MPRPLGEHTTPWPEPDARRYVEAGYWAGVPIGHLMRTAADRAPEAPALLDAATGLSLTHRELAERADAAAARLLHRGLSRGDRIVVQLGNGAAFVILTLACLRAGIVPVMALPAHRRRELTHLSLLSEASAIAVPDVLRGFDHRALAHELGASVWEATGGPWHVLVDRAPDRQDSDAARPREVDLAALCAPGEDPTADRARLDAAAPDAGDVAVLLLSGGTTGLPKLIARTHDDYAYNAVLSAGAASITAVSTYLASLPLGHNFALACPGLLGVLLAGGQVVTLPSPEPHAVFSAIAGHRVTHTAAVPAVAARWLEHAVEAGAEQARTLRVLQVGGARLPDELARRIAPVLGARLQQVFGMAEGLLCCTRLDDPDDVVCTTQGRPLSPHDEVRLVDPSDEEVPDGEPGSLLTRGPYTPRGYYRAPEQNARAFTPDGWYRSGDVCRRTPDGNLVVLGRDKDIINRGGEKISAEEVENLVHRLPAVRQVAAVAMPDPSLGERVCVYVVARPGSAVTLEEIRASMEAVGVARFTLPERLELVDELVSTKVGKIDKTALRADVARRIEQERP